jgi:hypothetical protein
MSLYGWMILILSVGGTTGSLIWCLARVLKNHGQQNRLRSPADLTPGDPDR